jgi:rRNA-processing protein FCF1
MSDPRKKSAFQPSAPAAFVDDAHWIEIFSNRIAEDLKRILQEDMDWMTSAPILERLNRLREIEATRSREAGEPDEAQPEFRKAS